MRRRVLYVIGSLNVGGAERHLTEVAVRLKRRGWAPEIFALKPEGPLLARIEEADVPVHAVRFHRGLGRIIPNDRLRARFELFVTACWLLVTLWRRRPAIVHFFLPAAYIVGGLASLLSLVPVRIMSRRSLNHYQSKHALFARIERFLHPKMTLVCANSDAVWRDLVAEGIPPERLRLIHNGIETAAFTRPVDREAARAALGIRPDATVFVIVANLIAYKGHADLIAALSGIRKTLEPGWTLLCVGRDDGIGAALERQIAEAGLSGHIRLLGARTDVPDLLAIADVGILCSHEEGFSNAILEGMAAGLPMVVTDVGGNAEAVVDQVTGFVVPPRDPAALGMALLASADAPRRKAMGEAGRRRVRDLFSMEACIEAYETLYRQARGPS